MRFERFGNLMIARRVLEKKVHETFLANIHNRRVVKFPRSNRPNNVNPFASRINRAENFSTLGEVFIFYIQC